MFVSKLSLVALCLAGALAVGCTATTTEAPRVSIQTDGDEEPEAADEAEDGPGVRPQMSVISNMR